MVSVHLKERDVATHSLHTLKGTLRGDLIEPNDPRYDAARKVYNGMIDKHPRAIAQCLDVADVAAACTRGRRSRDPRCDSRWRPQRRRAWYL